MDNKYIINADDHSGIINWVGIRTENGVVVREIEKAFDENGNFDKANYLEQLILIDKEFGGFFEEIKEEIFDIENSAFFEEERKRAIAITPANESVKTKTKSNKGAILGSLAVLGVTAAILFNSKFGLLNANARAQMFKNGEISGIETEQELEETLNNAASATNVNVSEENAKQTDTKQIDAKPLVDTKNLDGKSVTDLLGMLDENGQEKAFTKIVDVQDTFNNEAAPTVKMLEHEIQDFDENGNIVTEVIPEKQLFMTFGEVSSLYLYANVLEVPAEKLANYFGNAEVFDQKTGKLKESLNQNIVTTDFETASQVLNMYYKLNATKHTGVHKIFESEAESKFFYDFEGLVLDYNMEKDEEVAEAIRETLQEMYMNGTLDSLKDKFPGATAIISTTMLPWAEQNGIIDNEKMETYETIYQTTVCNDAKEQIKKVEEKIECACTDCINSLTDINGKEEIIEKIAEIQNEKTSKLDRAYDMRQSVEGYTLNDLFVDGYTLDGGVYTESSETVTYSNENVDKAKAVELAGEAEVSKAESQAVQEFNNEYAEKNAAEEKRAQELIEQNEKDAWAEAEKQRAEYDATHSEVIKVETEEYFVPETNTQTAPVVEETAPVVEEVVTYEEPKQEVVTYEPTVEETFVTEETTTFKEVADDSFYEETYYDDEIVEEEGKARTRK